MSDSVILWTAACQVPSPSPSPRACSNSCPSSQWYHPTILILCCPLLLLPSIFPSIRIFSNESVLHYRWPKYRNFSFSISPSNEYSGLISFRIDWFDLLAIQRTLKSPLQHHSSKAVHRALLSINHTWIICFIISSKRNYFFQMLHFYFLVFNTSFCLHMYLPNDLGALWGCESDHPLHLCLPKAQHLLVAQKILLCNLQMGKQRLISPSELGGGSRA